MFNYIRARDKISKPQTQPQEVSGSDLSLSKANCVNIGLNTLKVPTYVTSDIDHHTSCL